MATWLSPGNSSTQPLGAGGTFTGPAEENIGYSGAIVTCKTDQDGTLYVDFSPDGTNWDRTVTYILDAGVAELHKVALVNRYYRVRVVNGSTAQTYLRLQTILGEHTEPSYALNATSIQPDSGGMLTRSMLLGAPFNNNLRSSLNGQLAVSDLQYLVGKAFSGTTLDSNFWIATVANNGAVTQGAGTARIRTGSTANGSASITSVKYGRLLSGRPLVYFGVLALSHSGTTNNITEWGVGTSADRVCFRLSGSTLYAVVRNAGADTYAVALSSWNKDRSSIDLTKLHQYEIHYNTNSAHFIIDGVLRHTIQTLGSASVTGLVENYSLPVYASNTNSGGATSDLSLYAVNFGILALGTYEGTPSYKNITSAATTVCKRGAGHLVRIFVGTSTNGTITLYDSTTTSNAFSVITVSNADSPITYEFNTVFNNGLTVVTSATINITVIYE